MTNAEMILAIQRSGEHREKALKYIYDNDGLKKSVLKNILNNSGNREDAEDVFQDTLILFDKQIRNDKFDAQSNWQTYFMGIAKWRWVSIHRKLDREVVFKVEDHDTPIESVEVKILEKEKHSLIDEILEKIGTRCKEILKLYKLSYSMEEIAQITGLSSPELAKKNAYECRKKFKDFVNNNVEYKSVLNIH